MILAKAMKTKKMLCRTKLRYTIEFITLFTWEAPNKIIVLDPEGSEQINRKAPNKLIVLDSRQGILFHLDQLSDSIYLYQFSILNEDLWWWC